MLDGNGEYPAFSFSLNVSLESPEAKMLRQLCEDLATLHREWQNVEDELESQSRPSIVDYRNAYAEEVSAMANFFRKTFGELKLPSAFVRGNSALAEIVVNDIPDPFFIPEKTAQKLKLGEGNNHTINTLRAASAFLMQKLMDEGSKRNAASKVLAKLICAAGYQVTARAVDNWWDKAKGGNSILAECYSDHVRRESIRSATTSELMKALKRAWARQPLLGRQKNSR
jgi:hypothetical protein